MYTNDMHLKKIVWALSFNLVFKFIHSFTSKSRSLIYRFLQICYSNLELKPVPVEKCTHPVLINQRIGSLIRTKFCDVMSNDKLIKGLFLEKYFLSFPFILLTDALVTHTWKNRSIYVTCYIFYKEQQYGLVICIYLNYCDTWRWRVMVIFSN